MKKMSTMILVTAIALGAGSLFAACGDDITCALGTVKEGGKCVPACASNEYFDGERCVTVCEEGKYWDGTSCLDIPTCDTGTTFDPDTNTCVPVIADCAPGTHLEGDECVADYLPEPDYPENPTEIPEITLAGEGESISVGGTVDTPTDVDGDGMDDADWDEFFFQTTEPGVYLDLYATSEKAAQPAFAIYGITPETCNLSPDQWMFFYERYSLNPNGLDSHREVYLPMAGCYVIMVTDYENLVDYIFGTGLVPLGGPDFTYYMTITTLPDPVPTAFTNFPDSKTGDFDEGGLAFYSISGLTAGDVINGVSAGAPMGEEVMSHAFPAVMVFGPDGHLMSEGIAYSNMEDVEVLFEVATGEYVMVQDFLMTIGTHREFELNVVAYTPTDCTANDCSSQDIPAGENDILTYDVVENEIFFHSAEPASGSITVLVYDRFGTLVGESYGSAGYPSAFLMHVGQDMKLILKIFEDSGAAVTYTQNVMHIAESLVAPGENTGKEVIEFPAAYYPAGIDQFDGSAGQLAVFTDYTFTNPITPVYPLVLDTDQNMLNAMSSSGGLTVPSFGVLPYTGRFLHWVHASSAAGFFPNTYGMTMGLVDVTPNVGMPTETVPIQTTSNALDANVDMAAFWFTAAEGEGYGIIATPPNGSTLLTEVQVFCVGFVDPWFGAFCYPGESQLIQVHAATAANAGEVLDSGFFTAGYDGEFLVVIRDTSGTATGTETFGISLGKPVCDLDSTRCTGNTLEVCNGYGWTEVEVCAEECATIGEEAGCVKLITSLPYSDNSPRPADYAFNYYKMVLASDATVDIEMTMGNCYDDDTMLVLLDDTGAEITSNDDVDPGAGDYCSLIAGQAVTGATTYYIGAYVYSWSPSANYHLDVTAQ